MVPNSCSTASNGNDDCDPVVYSSVCADRGIEVAFFKTNCDNNTKDEWVMPSNPKSKSLLRTTQQTRCSEEGLASNSRQSNRIEELQDIERALRNIAKARIAIDQGLQEMATKLNNDSYSHSNASMCRVPGVITLRTESTIVSSRTTTGSRTTISTTVPTLSERSLGPYEEAGQRAYKKAPVERQINLGTKRHGARRNPNDAVSGMKKLSRKNAEGRKYLSGCNNTTRAKNSFSNKTRVPKSSQARKSNGQIVDEDEISEITHLRSSSDYRDLKKANTITSCKGLALANASGRDKSLPRRNVYHFRYVQCPIQGISEQQHDKRLPRVKKAVHKCLDQLTKMEMKARSTDCGKLHRCKFTEAVQKHLINDLTRRPP